MERIAMSRTGSIIIVLRWFGAVFILFAWLAVPYHQAFGWEFKPGDPTRISLFADGFKNTMNIRTDPIRDLSATSFQGRTFQVIAEVDAALPPGMLLFVYGADHPQNTPDQAICVIRTGGNYCTGKAMFPKDSVGAAVIAQLNFSDANTGSSQGWTAVSITFSLLGCGGLGEDACPPDFVPPGSTTRQ